MKRSSSPVPSPDKPTALPGTGTLPLASVSVKNLAMRAGKKEEEPHKFGLFGLSQTVTAVLASAVWMSVSSGLILLNKVKRGAAQCVLQWHKLRAGSAAW